MGIWFAFLLKANIIISVLFGIYYIFLRKEKFFFFNRIFLLSILLLSVSLPFIPAIEYISANGSQASFSIFHPLNDLYSEFELSGYSATNNINRINPYTHDVDVNYYWIIIENLFLLFYLIIASVLCLKFLKQLVIVFRVIKHSNKEKHGRFTYCTPKPDLPSFSFFNFIIINRSRYNDGQYQQVLSHETAHSQQWHSMDVILSELAQIILWINPLMPVLKRYIKLNLEYLADEEVVKSGVDVANYQRNIVLYSAKISSYPLVNLFNSSRIKQRILMMNADQSPQINLYKYAFILPIAIGLYFIINPPVVVSANDTENINNVFIPYEGIYQFGNNKERIIKIFERNKQLVLKQYWDEKEIIFQKTSALGFLNKEGSFPLEFIMEKDGTILQMLAFNKDLWHKINFEPSKKQEFQLERKQLDIYEGYYMSMDKEGLYLKFTSIENGLMVKEMWQGKEYIIYPESDLKFSTGYGYFPVQFKKNRDGTIKEAIIYNKDLWKKVNGYKPESKKIIILSDKLLEDYVGEYVVSPDWILKFKKEGDHLIITVPGQQAIPVFPESESKFFIKDDELTTIEFRRGNKNGIETAILTQSGISKIANKVK